MIVRREGTKSVKWEAVAEGWRRNEQTRAAQTLTARAEAYRGVSCHTRVQIWLRSQLTVAAAAAATVAAAAVATAAACAKMIERAGKREVGVRRLAGRVHLDQYRPRRRNTAASTLQ